MLDSILRPLKKSPLHSGQIFSSNDSIVLFVGFGPNIFRFKGERTAIIRKENAPKVYQCFLPLSTIARSFPFLSFTNVVKLSLVRHSGEQKVFSSRILFQQLK